MQYSLFTPPPQPSSPALIFSLNFYWEDSRLKAWPENTVLDPFPQDGRGSGHNEQEVGRQRADFMDVGGSERAGYERRIDR